jgi:cbb3-type cytochrome oxidase maturation protein
MSVLYVLVPLALVVAALALWGFFWTIHDGQMDDLDSPSYRMLWDEDGKQPTKRPK